MADTQTKYWSMLIVVDEFAEDLEHDDIEFVAGLIDGGRQGTLNWQEMCKIRALLRFVPAEFADLDAHRWES